MSRFKPPAPRDRKQRAPSEVVLSPPANTLQGPSRGDLDAAKRRGASLLEILLSLLFVALVAGLAIPAWFGRHEVTLDSAAILLARDVRATQNRAAYLGEKTRLDFDQDGWRAFDVDGAPLARVGGSSEMIERRFSIDAVFRGVELAGIHLGGDQRIAFGSMGEALEGGSLTLRFDGQTRTVHIADDSGMVRIDGLTRAWEDDGR